jgi:hypothetical protein
MTYQIVNFRGNPACIKKTTNDFITLIPMDESNTDYQEYLKWVEEGNTPLPADE